MSYDGIDRLIYVTTLKSTAANQHALDGASQQKDLIDQQGQLSDAQKRLDQLTNTSSTIPSTPLTSPSFVVKTTVTGAKPSAGAWI